MWQQSGSDCDMGLHSAKDQIDDLNRAGFAGHSDWRLPTLEEAMSLVEPEKNDAGLHIDSLFDTKQDQIWTCDSAADVGFRDSSLGFYVSFKHGRYSVGACGLSWSRISWRTMLEDQQKSFSMQPKKGTRLSVEFGPRLPTLRTTQQLTRTNKYGRMMTNCLSNEERPKPDGASTI